MPHLSTPPRRVVVLALTSALVLSAANEGERRFLRGGTAPLLIKVDPVTTGSRRMVLGSSDLPPTGKVSPPVLAQSEARHIAEQINFERSPSVRKRSATSGATTRTSHFTRTIISRVPSLSFKSDRWTS